ncbi:MAG TPA: inositol-3-phosphate synthase [Myxococcales bacterium]|nr:inositol-3-phosphate synthase [Myxococcales bacterium]
MDGKGPVGLVVVGLGGAGSSLLAGVLAARAHLAHPFGSLVEGGGTGRCPSSGFTPLRQQAPFAELGDFALGAFELREDDAYRAGLRAGLVSRSILEELRPELRRIRAINGARQAPTRRHLADALAEDLRGFLTHHHCSRGVVVCTLPGPQAPPPNTAFAAEDVRTALEEGADWVSPAVVYAAAAAEAGCAFVAAGHDAAVCSPGLSALFEEKALPLAGAGLLGPDALLREALAQVLAAEAMPLAGAASLSTRALERGVRLWGGPDRTSEMGLGSGFGGGVFEVSLELRGQVALYLAARALDAALLVDLAGRAGRSGAQDWMEGLFTSRLGSRAPREAASMSLLQRRERMVAELPVLARAALEREAA